MTPKRTELQREVVEALVSSKAVDFEAVGKVIATYGSRAALTGDSFSAIVHWRVFDICIPPEPYLRRELENIAGRQQG
jgi:hypothetical protein